MLPGVRDQGGFPERVMSILRPKGGVQVNQAAVRKRGKNFPGKSISTC